MSGSFIAKRYNLPQRAYVDSKNVKLQHPSEKYPKSRGSPSKPPADGEARILSLPTELRLQIYSYLTNHGNDTVSEIQLPFAQAVPSSPSQLSEYAYLYRSPGRISKPRSISKQVITLFHICRLMREELIDECFSDRTFVLEASLYNRDAGGLFVLPSNPGPSAWVKKLVLLTMLEGNGFTKGIADLRPLHQMTNLKELCIAFSVIDCKRNGTKIDVLARPDNVLKAVLECVPKNTKIRFEFDNGSNQDMFTRFRNMKVGDGMYEMYKDQRDNAKELLNDLNKWNHLRSKLSGSVVNHSQCKYGSCKEGLDCVQSQCKVLIRETILEGSPLSSASSSSPSSSKEDERKEEIRMVSRCDTSPTPRGPRKKCIHGFTRCDTCDSEKGFVQKLKRWSGVVYRY